MEDIAGLLTTVGIPLSLILIGWGSGRLAERRHFRRLERRERALAHLLITDIRTFTPAAAPERHATLVTAEVIIATDYFKSFLAGLRKILGGELRTYQTLISRARREALVRLQVQAREKGYTALCNLRLNTADIGGTTGRNRGAVMVGVLASATAYCAVSNPQAYGQAAERPICS